MGGAMKRKVASRPEVIDISDDDAPKDQPAEKVVKNEDQPVPSQVVDDLQQKVAKLERHLQGTRSIARRFELEKMEMQKRVVFLEGLVDKKPGVEDSEEKKKLLEELEKTKERVKSLTAELRAKESSAREEREKDRARIEELTRKLDEATGRERRRVDEQQKKIADLTRQLTDGGIREKAHQEKIDEQSRKLASQKSPTVPAKAVTMSWMEIVSRSVNDDHARSRNATKVTSSTTENIPTAPQPRWIKRAVDVLEDLMEKTCARHFRSAGDNIPGMGRVWWTCDDLRTLCEIVRRGGKSCPMEVEIAVHDLLETVRLHNERRSSEIHKDSLVVEADFDTRFRPIVEDFAAEKAFAHTKARDALEKSTPTTFKPAPPHAHGRPDQRSDTSTTASSGSSPPLIVISDEPSPQPRKAPVTRSRSQGGKDPSTASDILPSPIRSTPPANSARSDNSTNILNVYYTAKLADSVPLRQAIEGLEARARAVRDSLGDNTEQWLSRCKKGFKGEKLTCSFCEKVCRADGILRHLLAPRHKREVEERRYGTAYVSRAAFDYWIGKLETIKTAGEAKKKVYNFVY